MYGKRVIPHLRFTIQQHTKDRIFAARLPALGLTGYGETDHAAIQSCKRLYRTFIQAYIDRGKFPEVLDRAGVKWKYAD